MALLRCSLLAGAALGASARLLAAMRAADAAALLTDVAQDAVTTMLQWYDWETGYFGNPAVYWPFWHTGNTLETLSNHLALTGDARIEPLLANSFALVRKDYHTPYAGNDDIQWHTSAWRRAAVATGNATYVAEVTTQYGIMLAPGSPWDLWNATCGGCNWAGNARYVNSVTNMLFATTTGQLARTAAAAPACVNLGGRSCGQWAALDWAWAQRPGLLNATTGVFNDGFSQSDCTTPVGQQWTYNDAWLDAWTSLSVLTGNSSYSDAAFTLLRDSAAFFSAPGDEARVMREVSCDATAGWCSAPDGRMFKGVFARHLGYALEDWAAPAGSSAAANSAAAAFATAWLLNNTDSLLAKGSTNSSATGTVQFGQLWQGPFTPDPTPWVAHSAGLDLVLAALSAARSRVAAGAAEVEGST